MPKILSNPTHSQRTGTIDDVVFGSVTSAVVDLGMSVPSVALSGLVNCSAIAVYTPTLFVNGTTARFTCNFGVTVTAANTASAFAVSIPAWPVFTTVRQVMGSVQGTAGSATAVHVQIENCGLASTPTTNTVTVSFTAQPSTADEHLLKLDAVYFG